MPDLQDDPGSKTEHLKVDQSAYSQLVSEAVREVVYSLFVGEVPSRLSMQKVRSKIRQFAAHCGSWVDTLNVIRYREDAPTASSHRLRVEHRRLLRGLRTILSNDLLCYEDRIWKDARLRLVNESKWAVFRVTRSAVQLQRIEIDLDHGRQAKQPY